MSQVHEAIKKPSATSKVAASQTVRKVLLSTGQPLEQRTRDFMQSRFSHDFSQVRVHADESADDSASALGAHAFTTGRHIVFSAGRYAPETDRGRRLLAHELTHVVQQRNGVQLEGGRGNAADSYGVRPTRCRIGSPEGNLPQRSRERVANTHRSDHQCLCRCKRSRRKEKTKRLHKPVHGNRNDDSRRQPRFGRDAARDDARRVAR